VLRSVGGRCDVAQCLRDRVDHQLARRHVERRQCHRQQVGQAEQHDAGRIAVQLRPDLLQQRERLGAALVVLFVVHA